MSGELENFLGPELVSLYRDGERLLVSASGGFSDYSFVVFPFAKVYEGFLKKFFFKIGAISEQQYANERWRVGRALNPQLEKDLRHEESVYDRMVEHCQTPEEGIRLADLLWNAWKRGRNQVFHFFPGRSKALTFAEAQDIVQEIERAMERAMETD
ncbi:hypothetical protein A2721_00115 [Candidatus Gottesmanbacteria bacterium RIFCSPHIGHO2_01_FULL_47_48]|uniref:Uncharacterized protein n=1 Tax=Candidatus Gottesmanbacteria bacterium RIFCSPHIGHO2_01_FULL_47_48 TaxID=1798381 RepID=A0A1F6A3D2_9BACT|nr:MAG: hypothetical protein A2721_00115 [Candidatus Gottesmanbacteria bacterium RIFCSPHIGHO2_01_FULL_47_48]